MGPRWIAKFKTDNSSSIFGRDGQVALLARFVGTFDIDPNITLTGNAYVSTAFVRFDATGTNVSQTVLDSDGFCDIREGRLDGDVAYVAGFTQGTNPNAAWGACSIATNRQDPIAIRIDGQGNQTLAAHWIAGGGNAQAWKVAVMPDHTLTINGIYSSALTIGPYTMPTGITDPSVFVARGDSTVMGAAWAKGFTAGVEIHAGPIAADGNDICMLGAHSGATTVFGKTLTYAGSYDSWIARIDPGGTERWVRSVGSTGLESTYGEGGIVALPDGGCLIGIESNGDIALDTGTYPVSAGVGLAVRFAADGTITYARRFPNTPFMTYVGNRLIAAYREADDVLVVELNLQGGADQMLGVIGGAGTQAPTEIVAVGPDAVAVTLATSGALTFGATSFDTGASTVGAVAVLGI
jgi:hypothetical protein